MVTRSGVVEDKGKKVVVVPVKVDEANLTVAPQLLPEPRVQQETGAGRKTRSKVKTGDGKVLLASDDKATKEAMRYEWTRGAMTTKDQRVCKNLDDVSLNQLMTQVAIQEHPLENSYVGG
ncbi:hypothetical protein Dimus_007745 [Dionaea muscipula]